MLKRTMIILITATLAGGLFASDAEARGGGGGGHMGGGHMGGMRMGGVGHSGGIRISGARRGFHGGPRFDGYDDWDCSPLGWPRRWPDYCY